MRRTYPKLNEKKNFHPNSTQCCDSCDDCKLVSSSLDTLRHEGLIKLQYKVGKATHVGKLAVHTVSRLLVSINVRRNINDNDADTRNTQDDNNISQRTAYLSQAVNNLRHC